MEIQKNELMLKEKKQFKEREALAHHRTKFDIKLEPT
jgi:hypothetical protein